MKILVLCHDIPSSSFSDTLPFYHFIKCLHSNHDLKLICFDSGKTDINNDIEDYVEVNIVKSKIKKNIYSVFFGMLFNMFRFSNLKHKIKSKTLPNLLDIYYQPEMNKKISNELDKSEYDLIYLTRQMANYVADVNIPKVIQPFDAIYKWHEQIYKSSKGMNKIIYYISYLMTKYYEKNLYSRFDMCLVVTDEDKKLLKFLNPDLNVNVIPNGVNTKYFRLFDCEEDFPSLIYVSAMSSNPTKENVLYFYNSILPLIRREIPNIKFYLVGRDPIKEIKDLSSDPSVIVTGYVDDVRPYLAKSSIFIAPMIMGTGIKNKVLEAMSMGKCVVSTKIGAQGINAINEVNMFITDDNELFVQYIIELFNNESLRKNIGYNARLLIEKEYSWIEIADKLNNMFLVLLNNVY